MNRREALAKLGVIVGGTVVGSQVIFMGCKPGNQDLKGTFSPENLELLNEFGETMIPATNTAGAKAANVGEFMKTIVSDFYTDEEQKIFTKGVKALKQFAEQKYGVDFRNLAKRERQNMLQQLEKETAGAGNNIHYYLMMKQLTIWGFLTSDVAAKEVFNHAPVPGHFDGCVEFKPGDKSLFPNSSQMQALDFTKYHI